MAPVKSNHQYTCLFAEHFHNVTITVGGVKYSSTKRRASAKEIRIITK